jgi:hypothetical protein
MMAKGSPGKGGGPNWPKFTATDGKRVVFGTDSTTVASGNFEQEHHCDFWMSQKG